MTDKRPDDGRMIGVAFPANAYFMSIIYTNWKGERAPRRIRPVKMFFGATEWHPVEQWLMEAVDLDKGVTRVFAMKDMERPA